LSNLTDFPNFLHCWKAYKICYKTHDTVHLTLGMLPHYLEKLKIFFLQMWKKMQTNCIFNHFNLFCCGNEPSDGVQFFSAKTVQFQNKYIHFQQFSTATRLKSNE